MSGVSKLIKLIAQTQEEWQNGLQTNEERQRGKRIVLFVLSSGIRSFRNKIQTEIENYINT